MRNWSRLIELSLGAQDHGSTIAGQGRAPQQKRPLNVRFGSFSSDWHAPDGHGMSASLQKRTNAGSLRYVRFVPSVQRDCHHLTARAVSPGTTATIRTRQHTSGMPDGLTCFSTSSSEAAPSQARASAACGLSQCQHGKLIRSSGISIHRCPPNQRVWQINDSTVAFFTAEFEITPEQFIHRGSELGHFNFQLTNLFTLLS